MDRLAGLAVPDNGGFPLIGYPDGGNLAPANSCSCEGLDHDLPADLPDFFRIVLYPARLWIVLGEFAVSPAQDFTIL